MGSWHAYRVAQLGSQHVQAQERWVCRPLLNRHWSPLALGPRCPPGAPSWQRPGCSSCQSHRHSPTLREQSNTWGPAAGPPRSLPDPPKYHSRACPRGWGAARAPLHQNRRRMAHLGAELCNVPNAHSHYLMCTGPSLWLEKLKLREAGKLL